VFCRNSSVHIALQTVCTYWLKGLCMKGDSCGFLHQYDSDRMPVCRTLLKFGICREADCPYKHTLDSIKECNMYQLGFCIYGPQCRYRHTRLDGPIPEPSTVEAAKPREARNINFLVNQVQPGSGGDRGLRRPRCVCVCVRPQTDSCMPGMMLAGTCEQTWQPFLGARTVVRRRLGGGPRDGKGQVSWCLGRCGIGGFRGR
jgi:hypothetical protein